MLTDGIKFTAAPAEPAAAAVVEEPAKPKPATKKRPRKPAAPAVGSGVTVLGDRFVCSYSAQIREHAIFVPGVPSVCFANIPCAVAWLRDNVRDAATLTDLTTKLCEAYEQPLDNVITPPDRSYLADFGGDRVYSEWIGELAFWDIQAASAGITVSQWTKQSKKGGATKRGKAADARLTLEVGTYSIGVGGAAKTKKVDAIDGGKEATTALTAAKAHRKVLKFVAAHAELECTVTLKTDASIFAVVCTTASAEDVTKFHNHVASMITGTNIVGPAVVTVLRKMSVKL